MIRLARSQRVGLTSSVAIGHSKSIIAVIGYDKAAAAAKQAYAQGRTIREVVVELG